MVIEFVTTPQFNFLHTFAEALKVPVVDNQLKIPDNYGEGFVRRVDIYPDFRLLIHRYKLNQELILKRTGSKDPASIISIMFYNNEEPVTLVANDQEQQNFSRFTDKAIQIASNNLDSLITFPAHSEIYYTVVGISTTRLQSILGITKPGPLIDAIINPKESFLFYESLGTDTQSALKQITEPQANNALAVFYYRLKAEAMLYDVFSKLNNRQTEKHNTVNKADVEKLFLIRKSILGDLAQPPNLSDLARSSGLSETKMKVLFRQVFGDSVYNYYQTARMEEAAYLLKFKHFSVSEAGYQLGFSNLSHFTRLFERHHQQKPKKFASGG